MPGISLFAQHARINGVSGSSGSSLGLRAGPAGSDALSFDLRSTSDVCQRDSQPMAVERLIRLSVAGGSPALTDSCCTARSWRRGTRGAPAPRSPRHEAARSARGQRLALSLAGTVAPGLRKIHPTTVANARSAGVHAPRVAGVGLPRIWTRCAVLARAPSRPRRVRQLSGRIAATRSAPTA